ncbi:hypothetical protein GCM10025867_04210 [Frondihabitans sucicola]|uniref:Acyltransferase 3 domain-containing protein n=1 Tax=Frondihabitans sucicola TaxID=1268041 RepID=A0ABM8GIH0_9MICO|nr:hypothetical protein GCM10025867_04210 [Frondihabitans sucicola]
MHKGTTNRSTARSRPRARRTDVEALRGWAVGGVLAYHLVGVPLGGVTGVDMFFAISGFLITDLLFREARTTGRVDLVAFILRRARRLVPMAVVVLAATIIAASVVWYRPRLLTTLLDALAAATSTENWHLIAAQTSYLQADAAVSPLQHFWSLSVEEQFYAAWPVAVAVTVAILVRLRRAPRLRLVLLGVAIAATAASLARSLYLTHENIDAAYFDTGARAWQLGLGAVTALAGPLLARISPSIRPWIVGAGALLALWSLLAVDPSRAFPMPGAIPAVVGTCLILGCGTGTERGLLRVLSPRPALWLGRHSYSIYLWHFPLVVFLPDILGQTAATPVLALAATLLLSAASFRFIEQPFLSRRWPITRRRRPDPAAPPPPLRRVRSCIAPGLVLCLVGVSSFAQLRSPLGSATPALWPSQPAGPPIRHASPGRPSRPPASNPHCRRRSSRRPGPSRFAANSTRSSATGCPTPWTPVRAVATTPRSDPKACDPAPGGPAMLRREPSSSATRSPPAGPAPSSRPWHPTTGESKPSPSPAARQSTSRRRRAARPTSRPAARPAATP